MNQKGNAGLSVVGAGFYLLPLGYGLDLEVTVTPIAIRHECLAELLEGFNERTFITPPILTEHRIQHIRGVGERFEALPATSAKPLVTCR